jgi:hypothetical protein
MNCSPVSLEPEQRKNENEVKWRGDPAIGIEFRGRCEGFRHASLDSTAPTFDSQRDVPNLPSGNPEVFLAG